MSNTILLKGRGIRKEAAAGGTITPGDLLNIDSTGKLIRHASAAMRAAPLFAVESEGLNNEPQTAGGINNDYVSGDFVQAEYLYCGCEVYALVAASASAIVIGNMLESDGAGGLRLLTNFTDAEIDSIGGGAIAQALEAVDNSGGGARARIKVVIL